MVRLFVLTAFGQNSKNAKEVKNFAKYEINAKNLHGLKILAKLSILYSTKMDQCFLKLSELFIMPKSKKNWKGDSRNLFLLHTF